MSRRRLTFSIASVAVLSAATAWFAARAFPLYGEPQAPLQATPVISVQGGHVVLHRPPVEYPRDALEKRIEGPVVIDVRINDQGTVTDARVVSGPEELRAAAIRNALDWLFAEEVNLPSNAQIIVNFELPEQLPADSLKRVDLVIAVASSVDLRISSTDLQARRQSKGRC